VASYLFSFKVVKGEISEVHCAFIGLPPHLLLQVLQLKSSWALCNNNPTSIWQVALARPFASVCKPPKVNLDYQRSKVHILGQLNCWQVWRQGLEFVLLCFALLVFCLCLSRLRQLASHVLVRERGESGGTLQVELVLGAFWTPTEGCKSSCYGSA